jgi:hypothetical protein
MPRLLQVCYTPSALTRNSEPNDRNLTASTSVSWTISIDYCYQRWASKPPKTLT